MQTWKTKQLSHEGFPLFLRYPEKLDSKSVQATFSELAVVTHHLSKVGSNGLPDANYNDSLLRLDMDVRSAFEASHIGITVLVETFAGKRNYYIYIAQGTDVANVLSFISRLHPQEKVTWTVRSDPQWDFINRYSAKYLNE